jgi:hypothetical protein
MVSGHKILTVVFAFAAVAACKPAPVPIPAPPPAPVVIAPVRTPARPLPPGGAALGMVMPQVGVDGVRQTPNRAISTNEAVWHLRAALNVAALNCQGPVWDQIAVNYNKFIANNKATLTKISRAIDGEYKTRYPGQNALRVRDTKMTDLYNYFSMPAVKQEYCDTALAKSKEAAAVDYRVLTEFSGTALANIDGIFIRFFDAYVKYEADLAQWNRQYGSQTAARTTSN